jgi:type VI secretion system protein VasD
MLNRRNFVILAGTAGLAAACQSGPPGPSSVTVNLAGSAGMNPGPGGGDRPVTVLLMRLKGTERLNTADYFALQANASGAIGGDLVGVDQLVVPPGGQASRTIAFEPEATHLGIVALIREPGGRTWRASRSIRPDSTVTVNAVLAGGGLSVAGG